MKSIALIVVLLLIGAFGYTQYKKLENPVGADSSTSFSALTTTFSAGSSDIVVDRSQIDELLSVLGGVSILSSLDTEFFKLPNYTILKDFSVPLFPAKDVGRVNPFAEAFSVTTPQTSGSAKPTTNTSTSTGSSVNQQTSSDFLPSVEQQSVAPSNEVTQQAQGSAGGEQASQMSEQDFLNSLLSAGNGNNSLNNIDTSGLGEP